MATDLELQKVLNEISAVRNEIKLLTKEIEALSKCKNNHEERIRDIEITCIKKDDHQNVLNRLDLVSAQSNKNFAYMMVLIPLIIAIINYVVKP
jgi:prefoldin subunit 5